MEHEVVGGAFDGALVAVPRGTRPGLRVRLAYEGVGCEYELVARRESWVFVARELVDAAPGEMTEIGIRASV